MYRNAHAFAPWVNTKCCLELMCVSELTTVPFATNSEKNFWAIFFLFILPYFIPLLFVLLAFEQRVQEEF